MSLPWARSGRCATWAWWWRGIRRSSWRLSPPPRSHRSASTGRMKQGRRGQAEITELGGKAERERRREPTDVPYCDRQSPSASAPAPAATGDSPDPWPGLATGLLGEFWFSAGGRGLVCFFLDRRSV